MAADTPVLSTELTGLAAEMAKQASLGHKQFCLGAHEHEGGELEYEWIPWSEAFAKLVAASESRVLTADEAEYDDHTTGTAGFLGALSSRLAAGYPRRESRQMTDPLAITEEQYAEALEWARGNVRVHGAYALLSSRALLAAESRVREEEWLIFSRDNRAWWRANRSGYVAHVAAAGRYTRTEALAITGWSNPRAGSGIAHTEPSDIPVPLSALASFLPSDAARSSTGSGGEPTDG